MTSIHWDFLIKKLIFSVFCLFLLGCEPGQGRRSVILVAVDSLRYDDLSCPTEYFDNVEKYGIESFCSEGVRFSHTFTSNLLSQPALTTLLTGLSEADHKVTHNGQNYLLEKEITLAEKALQEGFRTSFFSGGAAIWSKSGLVQGFELFDDYIELSSKVLFRSALSSLVNFKKWFKRIGQNEKIFTVFYLSDLLFTDNNSIDSKGEIKGIGRANGLKSINEFLNELKKTLVKRKRWNQTTILIVGLTGHENYEYRKMIPTANLYGENTRVRLLIKPAQKEHDHGLNWSVDSPMNLQYVSQFIENLIKTENFNFKNLIQAQIKKAKENEFSIKTGWCDWRGIECAQDAIKKGNYLVLGSKKLKIYNSLLDRYENSPIREESVFFDYLNKEVGHRISKPKKTIDESRMELSQYEVERMYWSQEEKYWNKYRATDGLQKEIPRDQKIEKMILTRNWRALYDYTKESQNQDELVYQNLSLSYLNLPKERKKNKELLLQSGNACLKMFATHKVDHKCNDSWLKKVVAFKNKEVSYLPLREKFQEKIFYKRIAIENIKNYRRWDINMSKSLKTDMGSLYVLKKENRSLFETLYY